MNQCAITAQRITRTGTYGTERAPQRGCIGLHLILYSIHNNATERRCARIMPECRYFGRSTKILVDILKFQETWHHWSTRRLQSGHVNGIKLNSIQEKTNSVIRLLSVIYRCSNVLLFNEIY